MNTTPFEKANELGNNLAASFALHQTLKDLEAAKEQAKSEAERAEIEIGAEILFQALIALAGEDIPQA